MLEPVKVIIISILALISGLIGGRYKTYILLFQNGSSEIERYKSWDGFLVGYLVAIFCTGMTESVTISQVALIYSISVNVLYGACKLRCHENGCCGGHLGLPVSLPKAESLFSFTLAGMCFLLLFVVPAFWVVSAFAIASHGLIRVFSKHLRSTDAIAG